MKKIHKAESPRTGHTDGTVEVECGDRRVPAKRAPDRWRTVTCTKCLWRRKGR